MKKIHENKNKLYKNLCKNLFIIYIEICKKPVIKNIYKIYLIYIINQFF